MNLNLMLNESNENFECFLNDGINDIFLNNYSHKMTCSHEIFIIIFNYFLEFFIIKFNFLK